MVARAVLVWLAEVPGLDRPVNRAHDLSERDLLRGSGEDVAATYTSLGADQAGPLEGQQDLLQVWLWKTRPLRYIAYRRRDGLAVMKSQ